MGLRGPQVRKKMRCSDCGRLVSTARDMQEEDPMSIRPANHTPNRQGNPNGPDRCIGSFDRDERLAARVAAVDYTADVDDRRNRISVAGLRAGLRFALDNVGIELQLRRLDADTRGEVETWLAQSRAQLVDMLAELELITGLLGGTAVVRLPDRASQ